MRRGNISGDDPELIKFSYRELSFSVLGDIVNTFTDHNFCINEEEETERVELSDIHKELKIDLICRVYELIEDNFTQHQKLIVALQLEGMKNHEIAFLLGCNRTAVYYCINGIKGKTGVVQGGYFRKLKKLVKNDEECLACLRGLR